MNQTKNEILQKRENGVHWIMFNRPESRNAMTVGMEQTIIEVSRQINEDPEVKAVIFTGAPADRPSFMAGADFDSLKKATTPEEFVKLERNGEAVQIAVEQIKVPTIAAMAGACVGGGALLAASCDVRIASPSVKFGLPIARTVGNCLSVQNYARLTSTLGYALTKDMIFSARLLTADDLLGVHAIREIVSDADLHSKAEEIAEQLKTLAPLTLYATKEALRRLRDQPVAAIPDDDLISACYASSDFREGVAAFMEKRKPRWLGR
ncbi:Enoyl-CoA hydratase/carnithine racemase [Paraburkholderia fungorum]|uniref:Enoyl-CoA hydratase/carnithine racemase n=1 Tax=Paraburkholderia fungorum TaxID=134537 RepID=A0A1H1JV43_9BURK|nr:enoyl-CoA hydratase [Paraburkholderia fungorum]SDR53884.1 Enoyl-CoA hydratase/carnithine racemase [Paraburkholderia fungorum]